MVPSEIYLGCLRDYVKLEWEPAMSEETFELKYAAYVALIIFSAVLLAGLFGIVFGYNV